MKNIFLKVLKNKSFNAKLVLMFSVAIVALILVVVILFLQKRELTNSLSNSTKSRTFPVRPTQTPVPTPTVSLPLTTLSYQLKNDWQSFTNDSLGFKIQYPQGYKIGEVKTGERVEFLNCLTKGIRGEQLCRPAFEISVYADYDGGSRRVWLGKKYVLENPKYEDIMVDGSKGLWVINNNISQLVAIPRGKLMYVFGTDYVVSEVNEKPRPDKEFVRMVLSTFRFVTAIKVEKDRRVAEEKAQANLTIMPPPVTLPNTPQPIQRNESLTSTNLPMITIKGNASCVTQTQQALILLQDKAPNHYNNIMKYMGVIECAVNGSGIYAWENPPRYVVGDASRNAGTIWYAGTIAHDAGHSRLYREYLASHPGQAVPADTWTGQTAEVECLTAQSDALKKIGATQSTIDYVNNIINTGYYNIPLTERWW